MTTIFPLEITFSRNECWLSILSIESGSTWTMFHVERIFGHWKVEFFRRR